MYTTGKRLSTDDANEIMLSAAQTVFKGNRNRSTTWLTNETLILFESITNIRCGVELHVLRKNSKIFGEDKITQAKIILPEGYTDLTTLIVANKLAPITCSLAKKYPNDNW